MNTAVQVWMNHLNAVPPDLEFLYRQSELTYEGRRMCLIFDSAMRADKADILLFRCELVACDLGE